MGIIRTKDGVQFAKIAPGGFVLLAAIQGAAMALNYDLTITSGTDGEHSGPNDPHHLGEAYDVRTHDVPDKNKLLLKIRELLTPDLFYSFIESEGTDNEHLHCQVKKGTVYPPNNFEDVKNAVMNEN